MAGIDWTSLWVIAMVASLAIMALLVFGGKQTRLEDRLHALSDDGRPGPTPAVRTLASQALPVMGKALLPSNVEERTLLQTRLMHAGLYSRQAMVIFLGVKLLLMVAPALIGVTLGVLGITKMMVGLVIGAFFGILGMIGPSFWLDRRKVKRQTSFRRALPDALDVLVICLEGGLSLPSALRRVTGELRGTHPLLATELNIVQREIQLGQPAGEALTHFADRADLEEIRGLALVIVQSEKFGASLVKALRVHADTLRGKRLHYAEEAAQKAAVKILLPTILCIFPGLFLVILGPAVMQLMETFARMRK